MNNLELYNQVRAVPAEAQKKITGGRLNGKTDINPMWRIKTLTECFGMCGFGWYYEIVRQWIEKGNKIAGHEDFETAAFVNINLFVKQGEEWSKPIPGTGGSSFVTKEIKGNYTSDEAYKMALTDAISVACKSLGIGADIYWAADRTKYDNQAAKASEQPPEKSVEEADLAIARDEISRSKTIEELREVWKRWNCFQTNEHFRRDIERKKAAFTLNLK